ncbi:hypothetical protein AK812_SmicGene43267 [Symbiodinium microadriaticum]|uniref:Uncharacterized protein n=1 Tax=Symbiodinium microadriaticum TaxID=2951 RepID=A0A1Q9C1G8_SYMMI|nr:hypothetical protein AK812_SmicGene43267 [Symbiodinium microadriaticum]CAE7362325.1 unnamed protein product [Symbiodinium microadriaticum]CAE7425810.1 unnamed protein product [Symbiodinium sp. KB8]
MESRCYLGNLSFTVTERAIRDLLESQNFVIRRVHIVRKGTWFGGHPLCSAFLTLASDSEVQRMVEMLNGILHLPLSPIALRAEKAVPRMRWVSQDPQMLASFKAFEDGYEVPDAADSAGSAKAEVKEAADDDEIKAEEGAQGQDCGEDNDEDDKTTLVLGEGGSDDSGVDDMLPSPKPPQETEDIVFEISKEEVELFEIKGPQEEAVQLFEVKGPQEEAVVQLFEVKGPQEEAQLFGVRPQEELQEEGEIRHEIEIETWKEAPVVAVCS